MTPFIERLDRLAGIPEGSVGAVWAERVAFVFLLLMVASAPHSIAATQIAWLTGMFVWLISVILRWRAGELRSAMPGRRSLDIALWAFFLWTAVTCLTSYAPDISLNKLRGAAVFLIFYFVVYNIRNKRAAHVVALLLIGSCMVNVLWMPVQRLFGRGVEIHGLAPEGPLAKALLWEGDTLLEANGVKLKSPEDVLNAIQASEVTKIKFYRPDFEFAVDVKRSDLLAGETAMQQLGFASWKKSRNWRSSGFYGHYTTYAEVLQLILSLVLGLFVLILASTFRRKQDSTSPRRRFPASLIVLFTCLCLMSFALLLTVTRASQLAFMISAAVIVLIGLGRKWMFAAAAIGLPLATAGLLFLQQSRQVGFFDSKDDSIRWRQTVWREGFDLWTSSPRNFLVGVGMDSIKRYSREWHLFDDGRLNMGHFHSTPLNLVVERGLPALLLWLGVLAIYARTLWRGLGRDTDPYSKGILLGCLGGMIGFFISGLVHYNLGDQEVAMVFFLLMGLGTTVESR